MRENSQVQFESTHSELQGRELCRSTHDVEMHGNAMKIALVRLTGGVKQTLDEQMKIKSSMSSTE